MTDPLVSVTLPVYNGERYVGQVIESVLAQTYYLAELIVVDDGSTDNRQLLIRPWQKISGVPCGK
jgi:glycosyltransferase involved in cell wall biosynthesis